MVDLISTTVAVLAIGFAALTWWESRRQRHLLETLTKSLPYVSRRSRRVTVKPRLGSFRQQPALGSTTLVPVPTKSRVPVTPPPPTRSEILNQQVEERRRLKLELEREKEQWKRQKDIAKALGWVLDRIGSDEDDED